MTLENRGRSKKTDGRSGPKSKGGSLAVGTYLRVPTQIAFSNSLCFPCPTANFPCANLRDL